ncbi:uncharacterized protein BDR25DRAFT_260358 [Lindgomyces ingoldianus]|uniref:Uncharacterized protein n=1 Tax=Lindgomyces ingoldianus TaxID=673940 RepID=A0ACB6QZX1_9PLEO|nr:uncharacterized protein BDR25DRAFT_260358 [Lindgomyces ingoldianus]KAF2471807.1 hypothetical protein BDR25DRAFT_260358 [Lindgomyces ingoldianus]
MLRARASRLALRSIATPAACPARSLLNRSASQAQRTTKFSSLSFQRPSINPMVQFKPIQTAVLRRKLAAKINKEAENRYSHERIEPKPEQVSATSTIHLVLGEVGGAPATAPDADTMGGVKHDLNTIKETFNLSEVPRQAYLIGLAGVLPYLATSLSTVYCAWEINHSVGGLGSLMSSATAETFLHVLEPLQIGYGAVILSFLGAIHWGLEFAGYGGHHGYRRYAIGVVAPAVAWPTVLMPVEYALITQFGAFVLLYYADTRASYRGWTPPWYAIYRFVLTFIVGASIVVSLIGRGEVSDRVGRLPGAVDRLTALRESAQETLAKEEEGIRARQEAEATKGGDDSVKEAEKSE